MDTTIVFRHMAPSPALEQRIRRLAEKLEHNDPRAQRCRVTVTAPHHHQHQGRLYRVAIKLNLPGKELLVSHEPGTNETHTDAHVAASDAFAALRRQLNDELDLRQRKLRRSPTHHQPQIAPGLNETDKGPTGEAV